jgi:hypothetical protein
LLYLAIIASLEIIVVEILAGDFVGGCLDAGRVDGVLEL